MQNKLSPLIIFRIYDESGFYMVFLRPPQCSHCKTSRAKTRIII
jgi:hypothetical protein